MTMEMQKISRIISELNTRFLDKNPSKLNISVDNLFDRYQISFEVYDISYSDEEIDAMKRILNEPRQPSAANYYWGLRSDCVDESELTLLGMMIDKAEIYMQDSCLYVFLHRMK